MSWVFDISVIVWLKFILNVTCNCTKYAHVTFIQFIQVPMIDKRPKCHNSNISILSLIWINKIVILKP